MPDSLLNSRILVSPLAWGAVIIMLLTALSLEWIYDTYTLLTPLSALISISALFFWNLARKDQRLPIFDLGFFYMLAIFAYGALPLVWHLISGMQLTVFSQVRIYTVDPSPKEFTQVGWMHVVFALSFACAYLTFRRTRNYADSMKMHVSTTTPQLLLVMLLLLQGYLFWIKGSAGVDFSASYADNSVYEQAEAYQQLGYLQQQFIAHPYGILAAIKIGLIIWLTANWRYRAHRWALMCALGFLILSYLQSPGGRFAIMSMFLAAFLTYHQKVQPIRLRNAFIFGSIAMLSFFAANVYRLDISSDQFEIVSDNIATGFSFSNEFQISYGSILELQRNLTTGAVTEIPWQVYFHEMLLITPQQILPFEKIDPVVWYVESTYPDYFNYGVIAQSVIGFGLSELVLRGLITGVVFAAIHNLWMRNHEKFWHTFFYIWLMIVVYQSFRNASAYILPLIIYQWAPIYTLVFVLESVFQRQQLPPTAGHFERSDVHIPIGMPT